MKADTFARLVALETLVDAEIGHWLETHPASADDFREGMISRVSDLVDEIDTLDAVAAARVYDAVVDFLAELTDDDEGVVEATVRFKRAIDRVAERGMEARDLDDPSTWAVVLDEVLEELVLEYRAAAGEGGAADPRAYLRCRLLLARALHAAERMLPGVLRDRRPELRGQMDRLAFAVRNRRPPAAELERLAREPQRAARRRRPTDLGRIGAFIVGQLMRRRGDRGQGTGDRG